MEIRRDRAEFLDNLLRVFTEVRVIRKKDLEIKFKNDTYMLVQTEKHFKILEKDGMIRLSVLDEYYLELAGRKVLDDIENLGYLAKHNKEAAEYEELEDEEDDSDYWLDPFPVFELLRLQ